MKASGGKGKPSGGAAAGGGSGFRGRAAIRLQSREVTVSKALSFLLRHAAKDEGVDIDEGGWVNVADVVSLDFLLGCLSVSVGCFFFLSRMVFWFRFV